MLKPKYLAIIFIAIAGTAALLCNQNDCTKTAKPIVVKDTITYISEIDTVLKQFDSLITADLDSTKTVGAAIAIVYKGKIDYLKCYGVKKSGRNDSVDQNTIFRLASVSKTMSGLLAGILNEENSIDLDEKVIEILPDFRLKTESNTQNLTVRQLLSHTSGLVPHAYDNLIEDGVPFSTIYSALHEVDISAKPGELYGYQNVIFSLLDTIVFTKTGKSFGELFKEKLFNPCKMDNASTSFTDYRQTKNKSYPHSKYYSAYKPMKLNDRYYNTLPAAGINASISDMANVINHILLEDTSVFKQGVLDTIFTPQVKTPLKRSYLRRWGKTDSKHYALGWRIIGYKNKTIAYHGGYVQGYRTEIALCRDENIGIVYLSNSPSKTAAIVVPTFLNLYFDFKTNQKLTAEISDSTEMY